MKQLFRKKFSWLFTLAITALVVVPITMFGAELVTAEVTGTTNDVTVTQGTSVTSTINLSATGSISCSITSANASTATVDTSYSLNSAGALTTGSPSSAFNFYSDGVPQGGSGNCGVTWDTASTPYAVTATFSAAATTPVGNYTVTLQDSSAGTTDTADITNPSVSGGKLGDTTPTAITVHVVAPSIQNQTINVTTPAPANAVYGSSFNVAATATSGLPVAITSSGACSGSGSGSASITMTSGTGTCTVQYNQAGNSSYNPAPEVTSNTTAQKANATIVVNGYTGTYDGQAHGATGTATGVLGEDLSGLLDLSGTTHTDAGSYSDGWSFAGNGNYNAANSTVADSIAQANADISVTPYNVTYDGNTHTATGTATGVNGEPLSGLDLSGTTHTDAGTYNGDAWSFAGDDNYNAASGTVNNNIDKASSMVTVTCPASVTYNGSAQAPCTADATGAGMSPVNVSASLVYADNINAGSATASANWDGDANHTGDTGSGGFTINKASSTVTVTCTAGAPHTYTGLAQTPCTAQATGAGMSPVDVSASLVYANNTNAGAATADASWAGDTNHTGNTGSGGFTIARAPLTITASSASRYYGEANPTISGSYSDFVPGEGPANLTGTLSCTTNATTSSPVGSYETNCSGQTSTNYDITYAKGTLQVLAWTINGFYQPVDMGILNNAKAGSTVPLKFSVYAGSTELTNTNIIQTFSQKINCLSGAGDDIETYSTGSTSLRYDAVAHQFIFNWQTPKPAGACYRVTLTTQDGKSIYADFRLK